MKFDKKAALSALVELLRIDTVQQPPIANAPFGEGNRKALDMTIALLDDLGYRTKDVDGYAGWGEKGEGELFGILGHLDVVPADGEWSVPPFSGAVKDGYLYGRGVLDDKGPMISALLALEELLNEGYVLTRRVRFIFGCNEESGWRCMDRYMETEEMPEEGISPDGDFPVIYAEKGVAYHELRLKKPPLLVSFFAGSRANIVPDKAVATVLYDNEIASFAVAQNLLWKRDGDNLIITAKGKAAHGSRPDMGENAAVKLLRFLGAFDQTLAAVAEKLAFSDGKNIGLNMRDKESGALTLNVGIVETTETELFITLDIRHPVTSKRETITSILEDTNLFTVTPGAYHDPLYVDPKDPLVIALAAAYSRVTGKEAKPLAVGGATYARVLKKGVAFGPAEEGEETPIHEIDERVSLVRFDKMTAIYKEAFKTLLF